ncbi:MAG: hypothetical protein EAX95_04205 [Candidatus Thorarchaeota archaeon]|nr:hypothetical protein [Candidatus Thorarchaeota archaeon]
MLPESDLEKMAGVSRQRLTQEFAETHANLHERARRVSVESARKIADETSCPLEVATLAYLIDMDGILSVRRAVSLLSMELERRASIGDAVPNLPGNVMEFSVAEARWISYIYGKFARELELKVRELANLEASLDDVAPSIEKAVSLIANRAKLAEGFIAPLLETWMKEHAQSNSLDALVAFGPAVTKWKLATLQGKLLQLRRRNQALFRRLSGALDGAVDSATSDLSSKRIMDLVEEMDGPLEEMTIRATAHLILHIAPRPTGRGDKSAYVSVGMASTRGNKTEPDLTSPFDFLERDVHLARRRKDEERAHFLKDRIGRVLRYLLHQGNSITDSVAKCFSELADRFKIEGLPIEELVDSSHAELTSISSTEQGEKAIDLVFDFVLSNVYGG